MTRLAWTILIAAALAPVATAADEPDKDASGAAAILKAPFGSIARQKLLQFRLRAVGLEGTPLLASVTHNRNEWQVLPPEQRDLYRRRMVAFLKHSPERQREILGHFGKLIRMDARRQEAYRRRAKWLAVVVESFTPEQRKALLALPPDERARKIIDRRDQLVREGKLKLDARRPTTHPASAPTTRPSGE